MTDFDSRDMESLKLTVDLKGIVWELRGSNMPHSTKMDVITFLNDYRLQHDESIRMVGTASNAPLLVELYQRRVTKTAFSSLEVCSPLCCTDPEDRVDPEVMLFSMRKFRRPPSLGGWHEFDLKDFPSYYLSCYFADRAAAMELKPTTNKWPANYPHELVYHHPAWAYLSFVEGLKIEAAAELIANLLDPRWYVDSSPNGCDGDRMEQYLGLYPGITKGSDSKRQRRYQIVLNCWKNSDYSPAKMDGPNGFIWRTWAAKGGGEKGDIAAGKHLVNYLRLTWTMALCSGPQSQHLFVPKYFFDQVDEIEAFQHHVTKVHPAP